MIDLTDLAARVAADRASADSTARVLFGGLVGPEAARPRSNRQRIYAFTPDALISLGQHAGRLITGNPTIPADARACGVAYDFQRDLFLVRVESVEFDEVPEGMPFPMGSGPWLRVELQEDGEQG